MKKIYFLENIQDNFSYFFYLKKTLQEAIINTFGIDYNVHEINLKFQDSNSSFDLATNLSFALAGLLKKTPQEVSEKLAENLKKNKPIYVLDINPIYGFINFTLNKNIYLDNLEKIISLNKNYGYWDIVKDQVMVEFGQPNTHKAMTIGHIKSAVTGLAISNLLEILGYKVIKANYFSDIGLNVAKCTWAFIKLRKQLQFDKLNLDEKMQFIADCYVYGHEQYKTNKDAAIEIKQINRKIYEKKDNEILKVYEYLRDISLQSQQDIFTKLGVYYDRQYPESETISLAKEIVYQNIDTVFVEDAGAIIFPGDKYGLDRWVFITNQKIPTYSAKDLGLAQIKFNEYPNLLFSIVLTSTEQVNYFAAIIKALELINPDLSQRYYHIGFGWLLKDGKKMSSKSGKAITVKDLFSDAFQLAKQKISENKNYTTEEIEYISEKVFLAGLKFLFLSRDLHVDINYDPKQILDPQGFSGPYILYSYVRACSILNTIPSDFKLNFNFNNHNIKLSTIEFGLLKYLYQYPYITFNAAKNLSPHLLANYLFELAKLFNKFYKNHKVLHESDENIKNFRIILTKAFSIVCCNGLNLLGIETIEKM